MKKLGDLNVKGKTVLLRTDLNSDVVKGKVILSERIKEAVGSIKMLKERGGKVVVIAHQGRPGKSNFVSLKQHAKLLNKFVKVKFVSDVIGSLASGEIDGLMDGEVILLENIRGVKDEFKPSRGNSIVKFFKGKIDVYVNDAFSVCHRKQTSILLPKYIKMNCGAGLVLDKEVRALKKLKLNGGGTVFILAGAKPKDNLKLLGKNKILSCGLFGQTCLFSKGKKLGAQEKYLRKEGALVKIASGKLKKVETPVDFGVRMNGKRREILLDDFPSEYEIFDIGSETIKNYVDVIKKAKAIYMKGPAGDCSDKKFCKGTFALLNAIAKSGAYSVIGGGHLSDAIEMSGISKKKFGHVSLSGGALLAWIGGEKLPGIDALK